jgi:hypothetical protein
MLLAIDVDVIFFLLVAVIGLLNQVFQKTRKVRAESLRQQNLRESLDRTESPKALEGRREDRPVSVRDVTRKLREQAKDKLREQAKDVELKLGGMLDDLPIAPPPSRKRKRISIPRAAKAPPAKKIAPRESIAAAAKRLQGNPAALREAIVLREILGPPVAMRGARSRGPGAHGSRS